jgi:hypothetical protein
MVAVCIDAEVATCCLLFLAGVTSLRRGTIDVMFDALHPSRSFQVGSIGYARMYIRQISS